MAPQVVTRGEMISQWLGRNKERVTTVCPLCGQSNWELLDHIKPPMHGCHFVICKNDGFMTYDPFIPNIKDYYSNNMRPQSPEFITSKLAKLVKHKKLIFKYLEDNKIFPSSVLDYGCSDGYLLEEFKKQFPDIKEQGIELNKYHALYGKLITGLNITMDDNLSKIDTESKDIVVLYHVLEHIYRPDIFIKELLSKLKTGGLLYIALPVINRCDYPVLYADLKSGQPLLDHAGNQVEHGNALLKSEHLNIFTENTLKELLQKNGMVIKFTDNTFYGYTIIAEKQYMELPVLQDTYEESRKMIEKISQAYSCLAQTDNAFIRPEQIRQALEQGLQIFDNIPEMIYKYTMLLEEVDAIYTFKNYIKEKPQFKELLLHLAMLYHKTGEFSSAEEYYRLYVEHHGWDMHTYSACIDLMIQQGKLIDALALLKQSMNEYPNTQYFLGLANVIIKQW